MHVPDGATCAQFTFRTSDLEGSHLLVLHAVQLVPEMAATGRNAHALERYLRLKPHHEVVEHMRVRGGVTMEVCLCKFWSSIGSCVVDVEIEFHGVVLSEKTLTIASARPEALELFTPLRAESLSVSAKATHVRRFVAPTKHIIRILDPQRYLLPQGRQVYELELQYAFEQGEKESVKCQPSVPGLSDLLYDSPFESQMWMVFDSNKQLMGTGDALHEYPVTLPNGKYSLRLSIRHDQRDSLEKLKTHPIRIDFALSKDVTFQVYPSLHAALSHGTKYSGGVSSTGSRTVVYISPPTDKAAGAKAGDLLIGKVTVAKIGDYKEECGLQYLVGKEEEAEDEKEESTRSDAELLSDAIRDARLGRLKKLREDKKWEAFDTLAAQTSQEHPNFLPLLKEILLRRGAEGDEGQDASQRRLRCNAVVKAAEAIKDACDTASLAAHYGLRYDSEDAAQKAVRKEMDKKKETLVEALLVKAEKLIELMEAAPCQAAADGGGGIGEGRSLMEELVDTWGQVRQWVAPKDAKFDTQLRYALICSAVERRSGRPGAALAELQKILKSKDGVPSKRIVEELRDIALQVQWKHWAGYYDEMLHKCFPRTYPLF